MALPEWTQKRLNRLLDRYRAKYWPDRLLEWRVVFKELGGRILGLTEHDRREIQIDLAAHSSDREVRATVLHELCHAAAGPDGQAHGSGFLAELERLLSLRAPIRPNCSENPDRQNLDSIPMRFTLCRAALAPSYRRLQREYGAIKDSEDIVDRARERFFEAGRHGYDWRDAVTVVGHENELTNIDGQLHLWTERYIKGWQKAHQQGLMIHSSIVQRRATRERQPD